MENKSKSYRSGRFYIVADEWFYSVRETEDQGPYSSKQMAEESLKIIFQIMNFSKQGKQFQIF